MAGIFESGREKTDLFAASHLVCFFSTKRTLRGRAAMSAF